MTEDLLGPFADLVAPEQVMPMAVYLAAEECELTHEVFSVGGGRFARIFTGVNAGWFAGQGAVPTIEEIRDHLTEIRDISEFTTPLNNQEEMGYLAQAFQG